MTRPGRPYPLGLTWDGAGVNAAVWASQAESVQVCLFGADGRETRHALAGRDGPIWRGYLPGLAPGQRYGLRVDGPYEPARGWRHNPAKLLLDPYARRLDGPLRLDPALFGYADDPYGPERDERDSAPFVPRCVVTADGGFPWGDDRRPRVPWDETVLYELHVRGFTRCHPELPPELRGTYAGLAHPTVVEHLVGLGVTSVELLPVQASLPEPALLRRGLTNYWGYNTIGFFAPHPGYAAADDPVAEFRAMVQALHAAGLEIILDVVYNHTAEGGADGPTLAFRGLDNAAYYALDPHDRARYRNPTGCGNALDLASPPALALVLDSLRYWVQEMHVDGFRFDLASTLRRHSPFLAVVAQDPVLREVKLIAEPWDCESYDVGRFPWPWAEWNDRYRDSVRRVWSGTDGSLAELATRFAGSADLFRGRSPLASVNFVTAHDGFSLADLVSYVRKHNEANGEDNRDGSDHNCSTNFGAEGPVDDPAVLIARRRARRAALATLLLSTGVPMLLAGDELGHTQLGNNNTYCQDNELSWQLWPYDERDPAGVDPQLVTLVRGLLALRRGSPVLRRSRFFVGNDGGEPHDIGWYRADGQPMRRSDWAGAGTVSVLLCGDALGGDTASYLVVVHPSPQDAAITLPAASWVGGYQPLLDTAADDLGGFPDRADAAALDPGATLRVAGRSIQLLSVSSRC